MRILDDAVILDSYDVVVVGSGLAGLTAASLIAKRGLQTLLVEQHYLPGGMCTTLRRRGFSFDTGTALMYGFGEHGVNPHRFLHNELEADVDVIEHAALLRMRLPDRSITFWPDYERFVDELATAFPKQAGQVRALYAYLHRLYSDVIARQQMIVPPTEIEPSENLKTLLRHPIAMLQTLRMLNTSAGSVIRRFVADPELLAFFDKLTSTYCYCTIDETPAILAAAMFIDNHVGGAYYPARSPQVLASTLEKSIERHGGQVLCGHRVDEIVIEDGAAVGVRLADGQSIRARQVVANVTVWNLYGKLIRPEHVRPERATWARRQVPTYPSVVLYLGVDAAAIPEGTLPVEMLVADTNGVNAGDVTLYISSLDDPSIAPTGMHAVTVIAPSPEPWPAPGDSEYRSSAYADRKARAGEAILDQIEGHFPGFRRHVRVMEVATPSTIERYTLKNGGAVGGPKQMIGQEMMKRLHARSEWRNLYLCGDSTVMGMGTPAVTVSGIGAANLVLRDAGLAEYRRRPFPREAVHIVKGNPLPPLPAPEDPLDESKATRLSRECEYCEHPGCTVVCPAGTDIRNVMRRIEAGNVVGAARLLRETNAIAEACGHLCGPNPPCEAACNRLSFSDRSVRIADLQSWVCRAAGDTGWPVGQTDSSGAKVAVVGAGPAGLAAAYYLARVGCTVDLFDAHAEPEGALLAFGGDAMPADAARRDVRGILAAGVRFVGGHVPGGELGANDLAAAFDAVYLSAGEPHPVVGGSDEDDLAGHHGLRWRAANLLADESGGRSPRDAANAAARGRIAARAIVTRLAAAPTSSLTRARRLSGVVSETG